MTEAAETKLQRMIARQAGIITAMEGRIANYVAQQSEAQSKAQKQRNEIGRLTKAVEDLKAEKADLHFKLVKAEKRIEQMQEARPVAVANVPVSGVIHGEWRKAQ